MEKTMTTENRQPTLPTEIPATMRAARYSQSTRSLTIDTLPVPGPAANECLVRVEACGVCGSDVHLILEGTEKPATDPITPGHEPAGTIVAVGSAVKDRRVGEAVIVSAGTACLDCPACRRGEQNLCAQTGVLGFAREGAFAEYLVSQPEFLYPKPENLPMEQAAIIADAVSTPFHALAQKGGLKPGESVLIAGVGGLGYQAVKIAKAMGASPVIALDISAPALELAREAGADIIINSAQEKNFARLARKQTGGVDLAADFTGVQSVQEGAFRSLGRGGRLVLVGLGRGGFQIRHSAFLTVAQQAVLGSFGCGQSDIPAILELWESGRLDLSDSVTSLHGLAELEDCLKNLRDKKDSTIRQVIQPFR